MDQLRYWLGKGVPRDTEYRSCENLYTYWLTESQSHIVPIKPTEFLLRVSILGGIKGFLSVELYVVGIGNDPLTIV